MVKQRDTSSLLCQDCITKIHKEEGFKEGTVKHSILGKKNLSLMTDFSLASMDGAHRSAPLNNGRGQSGREPWLLRQWERVFTCVTKSFCCPNQFMLDLKRWNFKLSLNSSKMCDLRIKTMFVEESSKNYRGVVGFNVCVHLVGVHS